MKFIIIGLAVLFTFFAFGEAEKNFDDVVDEMITSLESAKRETDMKLKILRSVKDTSNADDKEESNGNQVENAEVKEIEENSDEKNEKKEKEISSKEEIKEVGKEASRNVLADVLTSMIDKTKKSAENKKRQSPSYSTAYHGKREIADVSNEKKDEEKEESSKTEDKEQEKETKKSTTAKRFLRKFFQRKKKPSKGGSSDQHKKSIEEKDHKENPFSTYGYHGKKSIEKEAKKDETDRELDNVLTKLNSMLDKRIREAMTKSK